MHFRRDFPSKSEHYIDDVVVAARMDILECGNTSVDPVIYAHTIAGAVHCNVAAGGIAPYDAAVSPSVKVVVECVDTAAHNTLRMGTTALTEGNGVRDAGWAVHVNVTGGIKLDIAKHVITSKVHPGNVKGACIPLLRCQRKS